jgi:hypothetical protein
LFHSLELRCLAHRWSFPPLETLRCRPSSFQKLTLFSQKIIVRYPPSSNTDSVLKTYTVLLPFTWKWLFCTKLMSLTL